MHKKKTDGDFSWHVIITLQREYESQYMDFYVFNERTKWSSQANEYVLSAWVDVK